MSTAYTARGRGLSGKVDDIVTFIAVKCNDNTSVAAAEGVTQIKGLQTTATFYLKVRGVNFITCT